MFSFLCMSEAQCKCTIRLTGVSDNEGRLAKYSITIVVKKTVCLVGGNVMSAIKPQFPQDCT